MNVQIKDEKKNYLKILKEENERLSNNISKLYEEKTNLEKKLYIIQQ